MIDVIQEQNMQRIPSMIQKYAEVIGVSFLGNGNTIQRTQLLIILVLGKLYPLICYKY